MNACAPSSWPRRSSPTATNASPSSRTRSSSARRSDASGRRSRPDGLTSSAPSSSPIRPARCSRSHGTPANWSACVVSCSATQRSSWSGSASSVLAAWPRLGATNSSRAGAAGSSGGKSYWPSTRPARKPEMAPASSASSAPAAPPSGPSRAPSRSATGSSTPPSERRLASIHWPRSTASATGSGVQRLEPGVGGDEPLALGGRVRQPLERRAGHPRAAARRCRGPPARRDSSRSRVPWWQRSKPGLGRHGWRPFHQAPPDAGKGYQRHAADSASPASERAATTGECGSRSSGAASGSSNAVKAT